MNPKKLKQWKCKLLNHIHTYARSKWKSFFNGSASDAWFLFSHFFEKCHVTGPRAPANWYTNSLSVINAHAFVWINITFEETPLENIITPFGATCTLIWFIRSLAYILVSWVVRPARKAIGYAVSNATITDNTRTAGRKSILNTFSAANRHGKGKFWIFIEVRDTQLHSNEIVCVSIDGLFKVFWLHLLVKWTNCLTQDTNHSRLKFSVINITRNHVGNHDMDEFGEEEGGKLHKFSGRYMLRSSSQPSLSLTRHSRAGR